MSPSNARIRVRVVAKNADGTGCVVMWTSKKREESPLTDADDFREKMALLSDRDPEYSGKPFIDLFDDQLPDLQRQGLWQLVDGRVVLAE